MISKFIAECKSIGIDIDNEKIDKLELFYNLLIEWNEKINLTRITLKEDVFFKHYYDSLTINRVIDMSNVNNLLDVGTGAGFPGIILKIVFPNINVTLVDSLSKRCEYLKDIINRLGLTNIEVIHYRGEDFSRINREKYDLVVARAVSELRIISEICIPSVKVNGYFVAYKSNIDEEIELGRKAINKLGSEIEKIDEFDLPNNMGFRSLVVVKKTEKTKNIYPREFSRIKKYSL